MSRPLAERIEDDIRPVVVGSGKPEEQSYSAITHHLPGKTPDVLLLLPVALAKPLETRIKAPEVLHCSFSGPLYQLLEIPEASWFHHGVQRMSARPAFRITVSCSRQLRIAMQRPTECCNPANHCLVSCIISSVAWPRFARSSSNCSSRMRTSESSLAS